MHPTLKNVFLRLAGAGLVRGVGERATVDTRINVPRPPDRLAAKLDEAAAELDEGALIVSRTVGADGRSRAQLGGRPVPVGGGEGRPARAQADRRGGAVLHAGLRHRERGRASVGLPGSERP